MVPCDFITGGRITAQLVFTHDSESQIQPITIDPITGEYKLTIPEWMMNEYGWYEGMNLEWFIDIDGIHILEEEE